TGVGRWGWSGPGGSSRSGRGQPGTRRRLALSPPGPQAEGGIRMEPPPSVPCATGTIPDATAAPDPPLEPPVEYPVSQGLRQGPYSRGSVVVVFPSSGTLVVPRTTMPAAL